MDTNPDQDLFRIRIGRPWMPVRFWIRQDTDPTGSTTQQFFFVVIVKNLSLQLDSDSDQ
jgi:hypothetical protein